MKYLQKKGMIFVIVVVTALDVVATEHIISHADMIINKVVLCMFFPDFALLFFSGLTYPVFALVYFIKDTREISPFRKCIAILKRILAGIVTLAAFPILYVWIFVWIYYREFIKDDFPALNQRGESRGIIFCGCSLGTATILTVVTLIYSVLLGQIGRKPFKRAYMAFCRLQNEYEPWCIYFLVSWLALRTAQSAKVAVVTVRLFSIIMHYQIIFMVIFSALCIPILLKTVWHWRWERKYREKLENSEVAPPISTVPFP